MKYDSQRKRLEASELAALEATPEPGLDEPAARTFLHTVTTSAWWRGHFPEVYRRLPGGVPLEVDGTRLGRPACGPAGVVLSTAMFRRGQISEALLLHAVSHVVAGQHHDRAFAAVLLALWGRFLGRAAKQRLRLEMVARRVSYRKVKDLRPEVRARLALHGRVVLGRSRRQALGLWAPLVRSCCGLPMLQTFEGSRCLHSCSATCGRVALEERLGPEVPA